MNNFYWAAFSLKYNRAAAAAAAMKIEKVVTNVLVEKNERQNT